MHEGGINIGLLDRVERIVRERIDDLAGRKLNHVAEVVEQQALEIANMRSDIRLLNFKMMLIGFVTGLVTSAVVSAVVSALMRAPAK
jgi:hypothetical protein